MNRIDFLSRIPPELLGEICYRSSVLTADAALTLAFVSRTFHMIVRTNPRIWQNLHLVTSQENSEACVLKAEQWFRMSGACPVDLLVEIDLEPITQSANGTTGQLRLATYLSSYIDRIRTLSLRCASEKQSYAFLSELYCSHSSSPGSIPLEDLTLHVKHEAVLSLRNTSTRPSIIPLPALPFLTDLTLSNHTIKFLPTINFLELRSLEIVGPVGSAPLELSDIIHALRFTPSLERLKIEGRISHTNSSPTSSFHLKDELGEANDEADSSNSDLTTLPSLTDLSLRINNMPSLVGILILPELRILHLEDLDGNRVGASEETGSVLRQLIVRMDLPRSRRQGKGLEVLELISIGIHASAAGEDDLWGWCFRRMITLREISVQNVNSSKLLNFLSSYAPNLEVLTDDQALLPCPNLESVRIKDTAKPIAIDSFIRRRPNVMVEIESLKTEIIENPFVGPGL